MQISTENGLQFTFLIQRHYFLKSDRKIAESTKPETLKFSSRTFHFLKKLAQPQKKYKLTWNITALFFS